MKTNSTTSSPRSAASTATGLRSGKRQQRQGLPSRPDHQPQQNTEGEPESVLPTIDMEKRRLHRGFGTTQILLLMQKDAPEFFDRAEVVGKWVWVSFSEKQPPEVTAHLAELGFHWNNRRAVWQHPCGAIAQGAAHDPHQKYQSYFPAQVATA